MEELKSLAAIFQAFLPILLLLVIGYVILKSIVKPPRRLRRAESEKFLKAESEKIEGLWSENDEFFMPGGLSYSDDD